MARPPASCSGASTTCRCTPTQAIASSAPARTVASSRPRRGRWWLTSEAAQPAEPAPASVPRSLADQLLEVLGDLRQGHEAAMEVVVHRGHGQLPDAGHLV